MTTRGRTIGVIPARAGSQRLPGKNLRPMAGQPMILWTLQAARAATTLDGLVVTSDDDAVLALAEGQGVAAVRRPAHLAGADADVVDAVEHALAQVSGEWDEVVLLQPTSPLRRPTDIDGVVRLRRDQSAPAALSVSPLAKPVAFHLRQEPTGRLASAPPLDDVVVVNGAVYVIRTPVLLATRSFRPEGTVGYRMPAERGWDVDTFAEFLACEAALAVANEASL
ncbi:NTP transferase domain-containing protein [Rhizobium sp. CRIBSB]|nr:NTP transferase domain-containing protein [Rhizobium sp. CRIBSB]